MNTIAEAEKDLLKNWRLVAIYVLASAALVTAYVGVINLLELWVPEDVKPKPVAYAAATFALELVVVMVIAGLQAVLFSMIGAEIDRPMWKFGGTKEALERHFGLWFIISLCHLVILRLQVSFIDQGLESAAYTLELPRLLWTCAYMPIGVCIMYGGKLVWEEVPERLSPLFYLFPRAAVAFGLGFLQYVAWIIIIESIPQGYRDYAIVNGIANIPNLLLECLAFAVVWQLCMVYRDTAHERDDDFDF